MMQIAPPELIVADRGPGMSDRPIDDETIVTLFGRLIEDSRHVVQAEIAYYKTSLASRVSDAQGAVVFGICALLLANAALIALLVGLIMLLSPVIGIGWATAAVVFGTLVIAAVLGWLALGRIRRATASRKATK